MPTCFFNGFIEPKLIGLTIYPLPALRFTNPESGITADYVVSIKENLITVKVDTDQDINTPEQSIYDQAMRLVRTAADLFSFQSGFVISVHLDTFTKSSGETIPILVQHKKLAALCTAFNDISMRQIYSMAGIEQSTFFALADLIVAVSIPQQAASNCAKVLDSIRLIVAPSAKEIQGWQILRETLNADEPYLKYITDTSKKPRHGNRTYIPAAPLMESISRTWIMMDRLLEYKKRGARSLPISEFPLLRG